MSDKVTYRVKDCFLVARSPGEVFHVFDRPEKIASCLPTLRSYTVDPQGGIDGEVGVTVLRVPLESKVHVEVARREPPHCLLLQGVSFMGEMPEGLEDTRKPRRGGGLALSQVLIHVDLASAPEAGWTTVLYEIAVTSDGRFRRVYDFILEHQVNELRQQFRDRLGRALERARVTDAPDAVAHSAKCQSAAFQGKA